MTLHYLHLQAGAALPPMAFDAPFKVVVVIEQAATDLWRRQVANWLIAGGCLYAMTWGQDCEVWHDSIDWAYLDAWNFTDAPEDRSILTTWHAAEPLAEVFWFAGHCAFHPTVELDHTLIVHISPEPYESAILDAYAEAQVAESVSA
jgi:hypothetical protein